MFSIDPTSRIPIYEQLQKQIIEYSALGLIMANDQLPSVRSLAIKLGINPNTVQRVYQELEKNGFIYSIPKKGCFIKEQDFKQILIKNYLEEVKVKVKELAKLKTDKSIIIELINLIYGGNHD